MNRPPAAPSGVVAAAETRQDASGDAKRPAHEESAIEPLSVPQRAVLRLTEQAMQDGILAAARRLRYRAYHTYDSRRSEFGFPDTVIIGHGHIIALELKGPKGHVTDAQRGWIESFAENGAIAKIVYPQDYDDALALLERIAQEAA